MKTVRIAVIGCGAVADVHLPAIALSEQAEATVVVDKSIARARQVAASYGVGRVEIDYREIVGQVDAAVVALPHHLHAEVAIELLQNGIHVLVEKPMALATHDCDEMIRASKTAKLKLAVGLARRFYDASRFVKELLASGAIGRVVGFDLREGSIYDWPVTSDFMFRRDAGGGVLADTGAHALDTLLWWLGDYAELEYSDDGQGGVEADCHLDLKLENGATGIVELSRIRELRNSCIISGEQGRLEIGTGFDARIDLTLSGQQATFTGRMSPAGGAEVTPEEIFRRQIDDFVQSIREDREPQVSGRQGKRSVALIEACYANRQPLLHSWACASAVTSTKQPAFSK